MAVPSVSTSVPANGAIDQYINVAPTITFAAALTASTVTEDSVQVFDRTSNARVAVTLNYDSNLFKVTISPDGVFRENTPYRIMLLGTDLAISASQALKSATGDVLVTTLVIEFTTGDDLYDTDSVLVKEADAKTLEGDLFLPSNVKVLDIDFTVVRVRPQNHTHDNAVSLTGDRTVKFTFSNALSTTGVPSTWVEVETYPLVYSGYLAQSGGIGAIELPTPFVSISNTDLIVTFSADFPNNAGVSINLLNNIEDSDGLEYGGGMEYNIATKLYPNPMPARTIKREVRNIDSERIYDDYVAALIHKNTMLLWEKMNRALSLTALPFAAWKYILHATALDIMEDQDYAKFLVAGTRKQLGDLNTSVDSLIGRHALKITSAQKEMKRALETLYAGWQTRSAVRANNQAGAWEPNRLWYDIQGRFTAPFAKYDQPNIPAANTATSRRAKTTNPWW